MAKPYRHTWFIFQLLFGLACFAILINGWSNPNSSADILDFSYDSSDERLSTDYFQRDSPKMSVDYGSEIRDLRLQGQAELFTGNRQEAEEVLKQALEISKNL